MRTDAITSAAVYALMIADDPSDKLQPKSKLYATVEYGSKSVGSTQIKKPRFLQIFKSSNLSGIHWISTQSYADQKNPVEVSRKFYFYDLY